MKPVLQAKQLNIGYAGKLVGENNTLELYPNELVALLGPNGSGKSTLFKTLLGLLTPLSGKVLLKEQALAAYSRPQIAKIIGYVPQAQQGSFNFTVLDMLLMGRVAHLSAFAQPNQVDVALAASILEQLGISHLSHKLYPQISGGERQLVLIARALLQQPEILILDEPTASLDFANQILVLQQLVNLKQQGLSVLLCTHQPEHAVKVADRLALFKTGRIERIGSVETLSSLEHLAWLYDLAPALLEQHFPLEFWLKQRLG